MNRTTQSHTEEYSADVFILPTKARVELRGVAGRIHRAAKGGTNGPSENLDMGRKNSFEINIYSAFAAEPAPQTTGIVVQHPELDFVQPRRCPQLIRVAGRRNNPAES